DDPGEPAHRGPPRAHPVLVRPRSAREPFRSTDVAGTARVAVGRSLRACPQPSARPATSPGLTRPPRPAHRRRCRTAPTIEANNTKAWPQTPCSPLKDPALAAQLVALSIASLDAPPRRRSVDRGLGIRRQVGAGRATSSA